MHRSTDDPYATIVPIHKRRVVCIVVDLFTALSTFYFVTTACILWKNHIRANFFTGKYLQIMPIKVGDRLPSVELYENSPSNKINILELVSGKKCVLFAVPGAFTPGCSKTHLPGYVKEADNLKGHGIGEIICIACNDPFVLNAWAREQGAEGKVRLLSDPCAAFTKAIELSTDIPALGGTRSMRYSMLVDDGVIKALNIEPDGTGLSCSLAHHMKDKIAA